MERKYCPDDEVLHKTGDIVDKAFYIGSGLVILYVKVKSKKLLVNIFRENEIVAIPAFHNQKESEFYLEAIGGTMLAFVTYEQMQHVYAAFYKTNDLSRSIMGRTENKIYKHLIELTDKGVVIVERFYKRFPELLLAGKLLTDAEVAYEIIKRLFKILCSYKEQKEALHDSLERISRSLISECRHTGYEAKNS